MYDLKLIKEVYDTMEQRIASARKKLKRPLSLAEKIIYSHLYEKNNITNHKRGEDYINFAPDRVAMQDATAQMALLQFMNAGKSKTAVPSTVHCDHLIQAYKEGKSDLSVALSKNKEVYDFLKSVTNKYGIGFWKPGAGIIHQILIENYAFPGGMMIGTDSHTVNAGGLGMMAIGVGGADAVDVMAGFPWELKSPKLMGIKLTGKLNGWTAPKDIILKVAGIVSAKGGTGYILEYFGEGAKSLSATGKGTICNMGAEVGATTSMFGYDESMDRFLRATDRAQVADLANSIKENLTGDPEFYDSAEKYFDKYIEIDLNTLEPSLNGPFTPDRCTPISEMVNEAPKNGWPVKIEYGLIGSCTNSSYEDITRASSVIKQAIDKNIEIKSNLTVTPGSERVKETLQRDGYLEPFEKAGAQIFANACGPCIGQWNRPGAEKKEKNTIVHSFNRNFAKRADGNPNTCAFVASPEMVTALVIAGNLTFNPLKDKLINRDGKEVMLDPPKGIELPVKGFLNNNPGFQSPSKEGSDIKIIVNPKSDRLQLLDPFAAWNGKNLKNLKLLIKAKGKCTTDHISMAGPWLQYRGHLDNISNNLLMGAVNAFNDKTNSVKNSITGEYGEVSKTQRIYKKEGISTIIVGDENYGEGSSREHAAMEPRFLGVKAVLAKSFARIHETNLKKQGMLALTFDKNSDYDKIMEDDTFNFTDLDKFAPEKPLHIELVHSNGSKDTIEVKHTYNNQQIEWFKAGSALNVIKKQK